MVDFQNVFYVTGVIFLFATISYFSYEYIFNLADSVKAVILALLTIITFFIGDFMKERGI